MTLRLRVWISGGWGVTCLSSALACLPPSDLGEPGPPGRGLRTRPGVCTNRQGLPRASERASEERALSEGEGKRPVLGPHSHAVCELGRPDSASAARRGIGVPGPARPPACPPAPGSGRGGSTASQPASQPASVFSLRVCVPRKRPPDWASPELSSRAETCVWMWCGGPSFRASLDGWGRKDRVSFHAGRRSSRSAPGRARARGAPAERPLSLPWGREPRRAVPGF